jgi:DNA-binding NarL/FixJ family response regulator
MRHTLRGVQATWPLVGRDEELRSIARALEGGRSTVVAGEPGVGKSRLVEEAARRAAGTHHVERVRGLAGAEGVPFGALFTVVDTSDSPTEPTARMAEVSRALLQRAGERALLLVVDDAHTLDPASAAVLGQLLLSGAAVGLVALRSDEPAPDLITALWKDGAADRMELQALSSAEVAELAAGILGGRAEPGTTSSLWRLSRGLPLYVRELLAAARESGDLRDTPGGWHLDRIPTERGRLRDLVADRLGGLPPDVRDALELLAVAGALPLDDFLELSGEPAATALETAGLATVDRRAVPLEVRCGHPLIAEVMQAAMPASRVRGHVQRLADRARQPLQGADLVRVAGWQQAGHLPPDAETLVRAGEWVRGLDDAQAERLARAAMAAEGGAPAKKLLADVLVDRGRGGEALALFDELDQTEDDASARVAIGLGRVSETAWVRYRLDEALALLDALVGSAPGADVSELTAVRSGLLLFAGRVAEAREASDAVRAGSDADDVVRALACLTALPCAAHRGDLDAARTALDEAEQLLAALLTTSPRDAVQLQLSLLMSRLLLHDLDTAEAASEAIRALGEAIGAEQVRGAGCLGLGYVASCRGRIDDAVDCLEVAVAAAATPHFGFLPWALDILAIALARGGSVEDAESVVVRAATHPERYASFAPEHLRAEAEVALAGAAVDQAVDRARRAVATAATAGLGVFEIGALHTLARAGAPGEACDRLEALAHGGSGDPRLAAYLCAARARHERDAEGLMEAAEMLAAAGFVLDAAETAEVAAERYAEDGRRVSAVDARSRARGWLAACPGGRPATPPRGGPTDLTPRETEVALLAARGLSDAAIAERLGIAVRTVTTHLHRTYTKLGIDGRIDLERELRPGAT